VNEKDPERDRYLGVEDLFRQEEEEEGRGFICIHRKLVKLTARHSSLTRVRAAPVSVVFLRRGYEASLSPEPSE